MADILLIIAPKDFRDEELFHTKEELENKGHKVIVASTTTEEATGMLGGTITPDANVNDIIKKDGTKKPNFQAVFIVGGKGCLTLLQEDAVISILQIAQEEDLPRGSICWGSRIAAKAGILKGKKATGYPDEETIKIIKDAGASYVDEGVVVDGKLITSQGPTFARDFGKTIAALLE